MQEFDISSNKFAWCLLALFMLLSTPTFFIVASYLETKFYPVANDLTITSISETTDNHVLLSGYINKNRDCRFKNLTWYIKENNSSYPVPVDRPKTNPNREPGRYSFGPWELWGTNEEILKNGYAVTLHDCHPLYLSRSIVYNRGKAE